MVQFLRKIEPLWLKATWILWLCLVAALPITSFPIFAKLLHTSSVAPASGIFILLLAILWLPVYIIKNGRFPFQIKPAILFFLFGMLTTGIAFFRYIPDYKNASMVKVALEGVATLGLGALFYIVTTAIPNSADRIKQTLKVVNWGGLVLIVWSLVQVVTSFIFNDFTDGMRSFQHLFSTTVLFDRRATGFASEPSWLAHELNLVYLMYWMAATKNKFSVHQFRVWIFTFENLLLAVGFVVLFATFSRGGLVAFMLVLAFLFLLLNLRFAKWLIYKWKVRNKVMIGILTGIGMLVLYLGILVGGLFILSKIDPRMEKVFSFSSSTDNPILKYADNLQFGERVIYWQTGWNIFNDYSIAGVGVGFSGYYFPQYLPDFAWQLPEVNKLMGWSSGLLNIKNLWTRLMAETGIVGFTLFIVFLIVIAFTAKDLTDRKDKLARTMGWMGLFMLITFILEEFSVDSFALPYYWFTLGLVVAASRWANTTELEVNG